MRPPRSSLLSARGGSPRAASWLAGAFVGSLLSSEAFSEEAPDLAWIDRDALAAGEVLVHAEHSERALTALIKIAVEIDAPPTAIWDVLKACELSPQYVPNVVSCRSLE